MCTENHHWHHDYVRLAWDSGFSFDIHKSKSNFDWSTIGLLDVERVARDRDIASVEKQIPTLLNFSLDDDQTRVLEPTFVKVFRLSQLSLQYLQFCKKYLDNTLVILKKDLSKCKEENANLLKSTEAYKLEISNLKKKVKDTKVLSQCELALSGHESFQCNDCSKMFMNEDFLTAHVKRRHDIKDNLLQTETNKLQLEIKELKERLNCTEKYIHSDHNLDSKEKSPVANNDVAAMQHIGQVVDLQDKFEQLKHHVERELNILRDQKQYQEKYEKWFEMVFLRLDHSKQELHNKEDKLFKENNTEGDGDKFVKREISTQTVAETGSELASGEIAPEIIETKSQVLEFNIQKIQEDIRINNETHIEQIQGVLEQKLTGGFEQIQTQMQTFWKKISDMEIEKEKDYNISSEKNIETIEKPMHDQQIHVIRPKPAPRVAKYPTIIQSKPIVQYVAENNIKKQLNECRQINTFSQNNYSSSEASPTNSCKESIDHVVEINISPKANNVAKQRVKKGKPSTQKPVTVRYERQAFAKKQNSNVKKIQYFTSSESDTSETERQSTTRIKQSSISTLAQRSMTSIKEAVKEKEVLDGLKAELEDMVNLRLKEVGVSEHWSGLPNRSFKQVLKVINHQAHLAAKKYSNYSCVRKEILKNLEKQIAGGRNTNTQEPSKNKILKSKKSKCKSATKQAESKVSKFSRQVEIKKKVPNSTKIDNHHRNSKHFHEMYGTREEDTSDISEVDENKKPDIHQHSIEQHIQIAKITPPIKLQTPVKKKVFFDLKDSSSSSEVVLKKKLFLPQNTDQHVELDKDKDMGKRNDPGENNTSLDVIKINEVTNLNDEGSTTSFPSSVLDGPKQRLEATHVEHSNTKATKDDTSDWDISDILI